MTIVRRALERRRAQKDPVAFARSLGVTIRGNVRFYGIDRAMFGSEPWLITIGDNVYITAGCQFITHDGGTLILRKEYPDLEWTAPIEIGNDVYLGLRTMILPGVAIGDRVIVAAGSVVTKDIPSGCVAAGVPARVISSMDDYVERITAKSLGLGHLRGEDKDRELRRLYAAGRIRLNRDR